MTSTLSTIQDNACPLFSCERELSPILFDYSVQHKVSTLQDICDETQHQQADPNTADTYSTILPDNMNSRKWTVTLAPNDVSSEQTQPRPASAPVQAATLSLQDNNVLAPGQDISEPSSLQKQVDNVNTEANNDVGPSIQERRLGAKTKQLVIFTADTKSKTLAGAVGNGTVSRPAPAKPHTPPKLRSFITFSSPTTVDGGSSKPSPLKKSIFSKKLMLTTWGCRGYTCHTPVMSASLKPVKTYSEGALEKNPPVLRRTQQGTGPASSQSYRFLVSFLIVFGVCLLLALFFALALLLDSKLRNNVLR
jgi:hypothetical protein